MLLDGPRREKMHTSERCQGKPRTRDILAAAPAAEEKREQEYKQL